MSPRLLLIVIKRVYRKLLIRTGHLGTFKGRSVSLTDHGELIVEYLSKHLLGIRGLDREVCV